jgi:hypothetical protein
MEPHKKLYLSIRPSSQPTLCDESLLGSLFCVLTLFRRLIDNYSLRAIAYELVQSFGSRGPGVGEAKALCDKNSSNFD